MNPACNSKPAERVVLLRHRSASLTGAHRLPGHSGEPSDPATGLGPTAPPVVDENHGHRQDALPGPVIDTLFGRGAVHTLDGERHRHRKALSTGRLREPLRIGELAERVGQELERACEERKGRNRPVLFDEMAAVLTRAVHAWAGCPSTRGR
ncbi:hypothetical protein OG233_01810 [Streptomyces sp. NBC_01218]|uniref:hypothetical protein n=1 Tax=Streptomyces sp. NBC_01218 TaxID=2903780 RepID=UPI002E0FD111|nr:hypothetical protein OG233_01810 [Streptomyces sp. NBC_01218]